MTYMIVALALALLPLVPYAWFAKKGTRHRFLAEHIAEILIGSASLAAVGALLAGPLNLNAVTEFMGLRSGIHIWWYTACLYAGMGALLIGGQLEKREKRDAAGSQGKSDKAGDSDDATSFGETLSGVLAGPLEEVYCRGLLLPLGAVVLSQAFGETVAWWVAAIATSVLFGVMHRQYTRAGHVVAGLLGFVFAACVIVTGSLWTTILAHSTWNLMVDLATAARGVRWFRLARSRTSEGGQQ